MTGGLMEDIWREVRSERLTLLWLTGNAFGFLCLIWLLLTA